MADQNDVLAGRTFQWTFDGGPTAGKTYEHKFKSDGTVVFKEVGDAGKAGAAADAPGVKYGSFEITPQIIMVSYLSTHGYTLTVAMNRASKKLHGFASNDKEWYPLEGTAEEVR
jgi:hypothetical protein